MKIKRKKGKEFKRDSNSGVENRGGKYLISKNHKRQKSRDIQRDQRNQKNVQGGFPIKMIENKISGTKESYFK